PAFPKFRNRCENINTIHPTIADKRKPPPFALPKNNKISLPLTKPAPITLPTRSRVGNKILLNFSIKKPLLNILLRKVLSVFSLFNFD
ncbi:MAG: hypothetical protein IKB66_03535, partial [Clostridia bacterium]|nr:hypothetical protein [Clostridia bacterium]